MGNILTISCSYQHLYFFPHRIGGGGSFFFCGMFFSYKKQIVSDMINLLEFVI